MGKILSFEQRGALNVVIASIEGDPEPDIVLVVPVGVEYEPSVGDPLIVFPFESNEGEFACWPGSFKPTTSTSDFVALKADVTNVNTRLTTVESKLSTHAHTVPISGPAGTTATTAPVPPIISTSATITGSDRFKVTHD